MWSGDWEQTGKLFPMLVKVDSVGRILIPKAMRDELGLRAGATVDLSWYGAGIQIVPHGRTARLIDEDGRLVLTGSGTITEDDVLQLIDEGREWPRR